MVLAILVLAVPLSFKTVCVRAEPSSLRRTPFVRAIQKARPSVVNIHGQKTLDSRQDPFEATDGPRSVNGMGTGVVIDERGYIITNHHVVDGVGRIHVTLAGGKSYIARLLEHDRSTDLAVIKIDGDKLLPVIQIGTSSDLMAGEDVVAMGNAYGYEDTVTRGVISALHRSVQISDFQTYEDLIQTDASINPGNSGGPLLNVHGEMIGINVAVRSGAQGIGFAIPVDVVMDVSADLVSIARLESHWHGVIVRPFSEDTSHLVVSEIEEGSPAAKSGLKPGDQITAVESRKVNRALDFERALLGRRAGEEINLTIERSKRPMGLKMVLTGLPPGKDSVDSRSWRQLGLRLSPTPAANIQKRHPRYRGGVTVTAVRPNSPADSQGIRRGDILLGMHIWETVSKENVAYILNRPDLSDIEPLKFFILRGDKTYYGHLSMASRISLRDGGVERH